MLWIINHPFQSIIEGGNTLSSARDAMIEKLRNDPGSFITKIVPAEPSTHTLVDLGKAVFGMK